MKLYLSSYKFGNSIHSLADMISDNKSIAIIQNARDAYADPEGRQASLQSDMESLAEIGLKPEELDLRDYFTQNIQLQEKLSELGGVWVVGGNTFVLRRTLQESGMDHWLRGQKESKEFVYAGYSAGICVLAPTLKGIHLADDLIAAKELFNREVLWDGLGLISYMPVPHYRSDHPESHLMEDVVSFMEKESLPYRTLSDGEVIIGNTANYGNTQVVNKNAS
jgi:dipeptidase E